MIIVGEARSFRNRSVARPKLRGATRIDKAAAEKNPSDGKPRGRWKRHSRVAAATALDFSRAALHRCVRVSIIEKQKSFSFRLSSCATKLVLL